MPKLETLTPTVAVIGGGPAGLSAATVLAGTQGINVMVIEREKEAGGIPRHSDHPGYGIRDRKRFMSGPRYARTLVKEAREAGVDIRTSTQVTSWEDERTLLATSPQGRILIAPDVFLFATGARERPRPARMIPGDRCHGVMTTGQLQNSVHLHDHKVGSKAVIIGAELVSWSAVMTLKEAGCDTVALVTRHAKPESYAAFTIPGKLAFKTQVLTESSVVRINGKGRVSSVTVRGQDGIEKKIDCDTVITTGDWIPDNELLRMAGVDLDPVSKSPVVDQNMATNRSHIFSVGNLNHPVETADVVALEGQFVATRIVEHLAGATGRADKFSLKPGDGLVWLSPAKIDPTKPVARDRIVAWAERHIQFPTVEISHDGKVIASTRLPWPASPGRAFRIPTKILEEIPGEQRKDLTISIR